MATTPTPTANPPNINPAQSCANCLFFDPVNLACHRYPPQVSASTNTASFPAVKASDWCGDWKD